MGELINWGLTGALSVQVCAYQQLCYEASSRIDMIQTCTIYSSQRILCRSAVLVCLISVSYTNVDNSPHIVYGVLVVEWVQTGLITSQSFNVFARNYGDVDNLLKFHSSWFSVPVMCGVVSVAVQLFYARRIWALSRSKVLVAFICLASRLFIIIRT